MIAVERDERAIAALAEIAERYPGRLEIVAGDALDFDPRALIGGAPARIVANLSLQHRRPPCWSPGSRSSHGRPGMTGSR